MPTDRLADDLEAERDRVALLTRKGIGMPMAGMLYWVAYAFVVRSLPQETALIISFGLTGAVFPVGVLLTRLAGGDLFAKSPSLTSLGLLMAVLTVAVFATGKPHYTTAPIAAAACCAVAIGLLWQEVRALASRAV